MRLVRSSLSSSSLTKPENAWVDEVKADLCRVLNTRKQLVTIFKFDSKRHNGNLEDAILEALLNGKSLNSESRSENEFDFLAAKFAGGHNEQHRRIVELKLAMVIPQRNKHTEGTMFSSFLGLA